MKDQKIKVRSTGFQTKKMLFLAIPETSTLLTSTKPLSQPLSLFCPERERERERIIDQKWKHTHTHREREI